MLVDVLKEVSREPVADGVLLYRFLPDRGVAQGSYILNRSRSAGQRFELFFCCGGSLTLQREHGSVIEVGREESILLSDLPDLVSIAVQDPPTGFCLVIDPETRSAFGDIYRALGYTAWSYEPVRALLQEHGGYLQIKHGSWNQSIFSILHSLSNREQGAYCVLKAAELFYLLNTHRALSNGIVPQPSMSSYLTELLICIGTYIENHLDEKLSISLLCRQFNLSPTTLKTKFREFYGQPIYSWIVYRRIQHAAELLQSTDMTILQIAQSVGYESVSQFNVVFRRTYCTTPSLYRKNVRYRKKSADSI